MSKLCQNHKVNNDIANLTPPKEQAEVHFLDLWGRKMTHSLLQSSGLHERSMKLRVTTKELLFKPTTHTYTVSKLSTF